MDKVEMTHPALPPEQTISAPERAVAQYRAAGWVPVDERPEAEPPVDPDVQQTPPDVSGGSTPTTPRLRPRPEGSAD